MNTISAQISDRKGNALIAACTLTSAIIIIFWLLPQFVYNTFYLYFRDIRSYKEIEIIKPQSNFIEEQKKALKLNPTLNLAGNWQLSKNSLKEQCERSRVSRDALNSRLQRTNLQQTINKSMIWLVESEQSQYYKQLVDLIGLDFYCKSKIEVDLVHQNELLLDMTKKISFVRNQHEFSRLHIDRKAYLANTAQTQLHALESLPGLDVSEILNLREWQHWSERERKVLADFFDKFGSNWIPGNLQKLLDLRAGSTLGLWQEIELKELLHGLEFRRKLYKEIFEYSWQVLEDDNFNPNNIKLIEGKILDKLEQKFKLNLDTNRYQRFLDFLIAPRGFERRVRHSCYRDLALDLKTDVFEGIRWQLRLIARIDFAIERIKKK